MAGLNLILPTLLGLAAAAATTGVSPHIIGAVPMQKMHAIAYADAKVRSTVPLTRQTLGRAVTVAPSSASRVIAAAASRLAVGASTGLPRTATVACPAARPAGGLQAWPSVVRSRVSSQFGLSQIGGYRAGWGDHSSGLALDVMVGGNRTKGDVVARWVARNSKQLNVKYVIWYQRIWMAGKPTTTWRGMSDRGSGTANHVDHVHISFRSGRGTCPAG